MTTDDPDTSLPPAAVRLLAAARRALYRQRAARCLAAAAWTIAASACGAAAVHLLYRGLGPAALTLPPAIILGTALVCAVMSAPSRLDAAVFIDDALAGRFAYRTLLELSAPAPARRRGPDPAATAAFLQWVAAHAVQAEPELRSRPSAPWPRAALTCAAAALVLAAALLQLPGAVPRESMVVTSDGTAPPIADAAGPRASRDGVEARDDHSNQAGSARMPASAARQRADSRSSAAQHAASRSEADEAVRSTSARSAGRSGAAVPPTDTGGLQAGTARDALIAAQLARAARLATIERVAAGPDTGEATRRRGGTGFEGDASSSLPPSVPAVGADAAAAEPPPQLDAESSGPLAQVLIARYLARLRGEAPGRGEPATGEPP